MNPDRCLVITLEAERKVRLWSAAHGVAREQRNLQQLGCEQDVPVHMGLAVSWTPFSRSGREAPTVKSQASRSPTVDGKNLNALHRGFLGYTCCLPRAAESHTGCFLMFTQVYHGD